MEKTYLTRSEIHAVKHVPNVDIPAYVTEVRIRHLPPDGRRLLSRGSTDSCNLLLLFCRQAK